MEKEGEKESERRRYCGRVDAAGEKARVDLKESEIEERGGRERGRKRKRG